jgi:hypothetical protein
MPVSACRKEDWGMGRKRSQMLGHIMRPKIRATLEDRNNSTWAKDERLTSNQCGPAAAAS